MMVKKNPSPYDRYIPKSDCKERSLGTGDTFHTVTMMQSWVTAYSNHVKRLAPILKKSTLPATIASIHHFLHSNIAYKADGALQVIKSPACAWATRNTPSSDCKTFSVFASCLLSQMGVPHAIRQVRQPSFHPEKWTHVYVVVPVDQNDRDITGYYYVLDGTVSNNSEVYFLEKKDEFMKLNHIGLAGTDSSSGNTNEETIEEVAEKIQDSAWYNRTFGAVFANGWDFSCFGSSLSPAEAKSNHEIDMPFILENSGIKNNPSVANINKYMLDLDIYILAMQVLQRDKFVECTRDGGQLAEQLLIAFKKVMLGAIGGTLAGQGKELVETGTRQVPGEHRLKNKSGQGGGTFRLDETIIAKVYAIRNFSDPAPRPITTPRPTTTSMPTTPTRPTTSTTPPTKPKPTPPTKPRPSTPSKPTNQGPKPNPPQKAGVGKVVGGLLIAGVAYAAYKSQKNKK
ncbi:hypothetical protein [Dokdonia sp.]|uniref:hypothetical protein n=1 Tax=Dokdonia sp. TaxID=2024995 RepID=UPI003262DCD1